MTKTYKFVLELNGNFISESDNLMEEEGIKICKAGMYDYFPETKDKSVVTLLVSTVRQHKKGEKKFSLRPNPGWLNTPSSLEKMRPIYPSMEDHLRKNYGVGTQLYAHVIN